MIFGPHGSPWTPPPTNSVLSWIYRMIITTTSKCNWQTSIFGHSITHKMFVFIEQIRADIYFLEICLIRSWKSWIHDEYLQQEHDEMETTAWCKSAKEFKQLIEVYLELSIKGIPPISAHHSKRLDSEVYSESHPLIISACKCLRETSCMASCLKGISTLGQVCLG